MDLNHLNLRVRDAAACRDFFGRARGSGSGEKERAFGAVSKKPIPRISTSWSAKPKP